MDKNFLILTIIIIMIFPVSCGKNFNNSPADTDGDSETSVSQSQDLFVTGGVYGDLNGDGTYDILTEGIKGAEVVIAETGARTHTDSAGNYIIARAPGSITLDVTLPDGRGIRKQFTGPDHIKYSFLAEDFAFLPPAVRITANPRFIQKGDSATLAWHSNLARFVVIDNGIGNVPVNGTTAVSPSVTSVYSITAEGSHGTSEASVTVYVDRSARISLKNSFSDLTIPVGETLHFSFVIKFESEDMKRYAISYSHTISPDTNGISVDTSYPPEWTAVTAKSWMLYQSVTGNAAGIYKLTRTVTINGLGETDQAVITVNVIKSEEKSVLHQPDSYPDATSVPTTVKTDQATESTNVADIEKKPVLHPPGSYPGAVSVSDAADIVFTTLLTGSETKPAEVRLEQVDESGKTLQIMGNMADDKSSGDLLANDSVYSGRFTIVSDREGTLFFRAKACFPGIPEPVFSKISEFTVTSFPIGIHKSDMTKAVRDSDTGATILSDTVLISFKKGTDPDRIRSVTDDISGKIIGTIIGLGIYQVRIPWNRADDTGVKAAITRLSGYSEVESASPDTILTVY